MGMLILANQASHSQNSGINLANMDRSVQPGADFYQFANGTWLKATKIPGNEASWGSFNELIDRNYDHLKSILEDCAKNNSTSAGSNIQKIGDLYRTGMDTTKLDKEGIKPARPMMQTIEQIHDQVSLFEALGRMHKMGVGAMFSFFVYADMKNSKMNTQYFGQAQLGLPDKMYYTEPRYEKIRVAYKEHLKNIFSKVESNADIAKKNADQVFEMESKMAEACMGRMELRNPEIQYNKFEREEFFKKHENIEFKNYFKAINVNPSFTEVIVSQPEFFKKLNEFMKAWPLADWKVYLKWRLLHEAAPYLSMDFVKENFSFYSTVLQGTKEMKPRWKTVLRSVDGGIGEALGQLFVEKYFSEDSKQKVNGMVDNLFLSFKARIETRTWMSEETKKKALEKLSKITRKLGYPDKWKDYTSLKIGTDSYFLNMLRCNSFAFEEMVEYIGKPVDKTKWGMTPPTVNAYYNPPYNEIVFPAGIMQPPFFDGKANDASNYGVMGAVIGHELTHGFDDQGAKFDGDGNLANWWTESDKKNFEEHTAVIRTQFDGFIAIDSLHVNGQLTLGENIADLGGLTMSYYAYKMSLKGTASQVMDGYSGEQRFFIAWAQAWKVLMRPEFLKQLLATNPHAPGNFRANAPLQNMKEFYEAFGIKEGDKMFVAPAKRAEVW